MLSALRYILARKPNPKTRPYQMMAVGLVLLLSAVYDFIGFDVAAGIIAAFSMLGGLALWVVNREAE